MFGAGVALIVKDARQRIAKDCARFLKTNAVLALIVGCFGFVPHEVVIHEYDSRLGIGIIIIPS